MMLEYPLKVIYDEDFSQLANLQLFFQLSRQLFFFFSTFNPKFFWFFNFRANFFFFFQLSNQKKICGWNFKPRVPGPIGRAKRSAGARDPTVM
jgi:hypothetical protein